MVYFFFVVIGFQTYIDILKIITKFIYLSIDSLKVKKLRIDLTLQTVVSVRNETKVS